MKIDKQTGELKDVIHTFCRGRKTARSMMDKHMQNNHPGAKRKTCDSYYSTLMQKKQKVDHVASEEGSMNALFNANDNHPRYESFCGMNDSEEEQEEEEEKEEEQEEEEDFPGLQDAVNIVEELISYDIANEENDENTAKAPQSMNTDHFSEFYFFTEGFVFFDKTLDVRTEKQKRTWNSQGFQNQAYFFQRYNVKKKDMSNDVGGFEGLCHRSNHRDRYGISQTADSEEAKEMFRLFRLTLDLPRKQQNELATIIKNILHLHVREPRQVRLRFPMDFNELRRMFVDGGLSIKTLFPVQEVVEIQTMLV